VIGGTGLIGSKLVALLREVDQEVFAAAPSTGVSTLTGEGLPEALAGAQVVVDVTNSASRDDAAVMEFFQTSGRNLLRAEIAAEVRHHIALSVVGADRLPDVGYLRAKVEQENLIKASGTPYTILRATEFFEFGGVIADASTVGDTVRVPAALIQPISSEDVASVLADIALGPPVKGTLEVVGPERLWFKDFIARLLALKKDKRKVVADPHAQYFGAHLEKESLLAGSKALIGQMRWESWIGRSSASP
jgi:uncharacterized protein YbjT (DUF2867 family)